MYKCYYRCCCTNSCKKGPEIAIQNSDVDMAFSSGNSYAMDHWNLEVFMLKIFIKVAYYIWLLSYFVQVWILLVTGE